MEMTTLITTQAQSSADDVPPGYKRTEVGVIPDDWTIFSLGALGRCLSGGTPSKANSHFWDGDIPWVSSKDMKVSYLWDSIDHIRELAIGNGTRLIHPGTILMVVRGMALMHSFPVALVMRPLTFNQDLKAFVPRGGINSEFILRWLESNQAVFLSLATEATHGTKRMPTNDLLGSPVALPPTIEEQDAIAAALSDVEALIAALDTLIEKKRAIKQATIQQLLTGKTRLPGFSEEWDVKRLGNILTFLSTANNPRADLDDHGDVEYLHYGDIHSHTGVILDCRDNRLPRIRSDKVGSVARLQDGDLVVADASEDLEGIGKSVEIQSVDGRHVVAGLHTLLCRGNPEHWARGFKAYLQFIPAFKTALLRIASGISVYAISKKQLENIEIALPPAIEQAAIAAVLIDMDANIKVLEERREKTKQIKQGMMQQLLTGRIRLVDPE